ncbi:Uncharacterized protein YGR266W [Ceratocystis fimbriata CBS 114723]|uniref:Uncharacterized protein YGR266W n=1 Tax=Ceratocystis fimbriata CBS 114723 TaxID=1035309 RepID=A0A2C5XBY1_9PEZI|nr:Uncharacterized protein YGR266W [Ceratocystis fimbriata CBS 114723]
MSSTVPYWGEDELTADQTHTATDSVSVVSASEAVRVKQQSEMTNDSFYVYDDDIQQQPSSSRHRSSQKHPSAKSKSHKHHPVLSQATETETDLSYVSHQSPTSTTFQQPLTPRPPSVSMQPYVEPNPQFQATQASAAKATTLDSRPKTPLDTVAAEDAEAEERRRKRRGQRARQSQSQSAGDLSPLIPTSSSFNYAPPTSPTPITTTRTRTRDRVRDHGQESLAYTNPLQPLASAAAPASRNLQATPPLRSPPRPARSPAPSSMPASPIPESVKSIRSALPYSDIESSMVPPSEVYSALPAEDLYSYHSQVNTPVLASPAEIREQRTPVAPSPRPVLSVREASTVQSSPRSVRSAREIPVTQSSRSIRSASAQEQANLLLQPSPQPTRSIREPPTSNSSLQPAQSIHETPVPQSPRSVKSVHDIQSGSARHVVINSPVVSPDTRRRSSVAIPRSRRKFANSHSPLQRLELTLDSMTKEEKRARVEAAERRARERSNLEIDKIHLGQQPSIDSQSPVLSGSHAASRSPNIPNGSSRAANTTRHSSSPISTTPQGTPRKTFDLTSLHSTTASSANTTPAQAQPTHRSPLAQSSSDPHWSSLPPPKKPNTAESSGSHKRRPSVHGDMILPEGVRRISNAGGPQRSLSFRERRMSNSDDFDSNPGVVGSSYRRPTRILSPEPIDISVPETPAQQPASWKSQQPAIGPSKPVKSEATVGASSISKEGIVPTAERPFMPDPILMDPHAPPPPPKRSSSFSFSSIGRRNSKKLQKDPPDDPFYRLRIESEKHQLQRAATIAATVAVKDQGVDSAQNPGTDHVQQRSNVPVVPPSTASHKAQRPDSELTIEDIVKSMVDESYASDSSQEEAPRHLLRKQQQEQERNEHQHKISNMMYRPAQDLKPGEGLYEPPSFLDEWRKGTVGTLSGSLLDLSQSHEQEIQQNQQQQNQIHPRGKLEHNDSAWWEAQPGNGTSTKSTTTTSTDTSRRRGSLSSRPRRAEAFDGEYDDRKDAPTKFRPQLYLKCGPLLRYTGIRRERHPGRFRVASAINNIRDREFWRGTVMIVTEDDQSHYEIAPTLRFFVQPIELYKPLDPNTKGPYDCVDPIASHPKVGRRGETLYVRPVDQIDSAMDLSRDETENGLYETSRTLRDGAAGITEIPGSFHARRKQVEIDGEALGKYKEVRGCRLHAERGLTFWRFNIEVELKEKSQRIAYRINRGPATGFWVPAKGQSMNIMFYSCNGFSATVRPDDYCGPDPMWRDVMNVHQSKPFHVMIGGGDQIYCDAVSQECSLLKNWLSTKNSIHKHKAPFTREMQDELEVFYLERYCTWYSQGLFALSNSQIPMVNMLDDHDIMDGYGSYPHHSMNSPVFKGLGAVAFKYYMLFQHQSITDETEESEPSWILGMKKGPYINEFSRSVLVDLGADVALLAVDGRTERTEFDVVSEDTWERIMDRCYKDVKSGEIKHLLVLLGVPIAYPRLVWLENLLTSRLMDPVKALGRTRRFASILNKIDGGVEVLDDLNDHWTAKNHKAERREIIEQLQDISMIKSVRVTILSGDVHLGGIGQFYSNPKFTVAKHKDFRYMPNVISSAIANAPPPHFLADVLNKRNKVHHFDKETDESMVPIFTHDVDGSPRNNKHLLPRRNWCSISPWTPDSTSIATPSLSNAETEETSAMQPQRRGSLLRRLSNAIPHRRKSISTADGEASVSRPPVTTVGRSGGLFRSLSQRSNRGREVERDANEAHVSVTDSTSNIDLAEKPKRSLSVSRMFGFGKRKQKKNERDNDADSREVFSDDEYDDDYESSTTEHLSAPVPRSADAGHSHGVTEAQIQALSPVQYANAHTQTGSSVLASRKDLTSTLPLTATRGYSQSSLPMATMALDDQSQSFQQSSLFQSESSLDGIRGTPATNSRKNARTSSPLIQTYQSRRDDISRHADRDSLMHGQQSDVYTTTNTASSLNDYDGDDRRPPSSRNRGHINETGAGNSRLRGGAASQLSEAEYSIGDETQFSVRPVHTQTMPATVAPDATSAPGHGEVLATQGMKRSPTTFLTSKQRKQAPEPEVDLQGALDICLHMEIDPRNPNGQTVPYHLLVPRLFFSEEDERALEEHENAQEEEEQRRQNQLQYTQPQPSGNSGFADGLEDDSGDLQSRPPLAQRNARPSAFKRLLSFRRKNKAQALKEEEERQRQLQLELDEYPDGSSLRSASDDDDYDEDDTVLGLEGQRRPAYDEEPYPEESQRYTLSTSGQR